MASISSSTHVRHAPSIHSAPIVVGVGVGVGVAFCATIRAVPRPDPTRPDATRRDATRPPFDDES
jgi:hypothetical protein